MSPRKPRKATATASSAHVLYGQALREAVGPWRAEVGRADCERLDALVNIATGERIQLSECLRVTFGDHKGKRALAALTSFRKRVNDAAAWTKPALALRFQVDTRLKSPPEERECWFTGPDPAIASVERYSEQVIGDVDPKRLVRPRGLVTTGSDLAAGRRLIRLFLSYAPDDRDLARSLVDELKTHFSSAARNQYEIWSEDQVLLGEKPRESKTRAIEECDFGLLLVSPTFLAREAGKEREELWRFIGDLDRPGSKPVLPVGLRELHERHHDLRGLAEYELFPGKGRPSFGELSGQERKKFALDLFVKIQERVDAFFEQAPKVQEMIPIPARTPHFQRPRGFGVALTDLERQAERAPDLARDALKEIEAWVVKDDAPPFFALLGEYGIGKTTTLKQLTSEFENRRKAGEHLPLPVYVDLRDYAPPTRDAVPTIEELLTSIIQRGWKLRDRSVTPEAVLRLVREEGAVILFDGLDERIVHLPPDRARLFIRTLWSVLPDATRTAASLPRGKRRGKLLISCRSHYFADVWSQNAMLVGEDREGLKRGEFPAVCLVPFTEEQIRGYLRSLLGSKERADSAFKLIASIHNLPDLARRPYLLSLIAEELADLEALKVRGERVNAARLYDLVVRRWLSRDDGKHQLEPDHKRRMMEDLAAALWRSGSKQWKADKLSAWLEQYLLDNPALADAYRNKDRTVLKEDLRTATFVLRPETEREHFRFAHTSLQEYFLASYLARALENGRPELWDLPMVSDETLDFLGQILSLDQPDASLRTMEIILGGEKLGAALVAFRYWLRALASSMPTPSPSKVNLAGADMEGWTIRGFKDQPPLSLRGTNFSGVKLNRARVEHVDWIGANLDGLKARQALFLRVNAARASMKRVDFRGLRWREGSLQTSDLTDARLAGCHWIKVDLFGITLPVGWQGEATSVPTSTPIYPSALTRLGGHSRPVSACAWSPDGQRLLSAATDNTLKVWDAASGHNLLTLQGHSNWVRACAWSPDGQRLLSASADNTLKVWDATSGQSLLTLQGHSHTVMACAWNPDGARLLSASADNTLKLWDAASGRCLLTLRGHSGPVSTCAWGPDGERLLSASYDGTFKLWDAASGRCLLTTQGHSGPVMACAWSPDGERLLSISHDSTLKLWDAASGRLLTLKGHSGLVSACAWSPDGERLLSASDDSTVKLWDAASGRCLLTLKGHSGLVSACAWSPDGERLLSASDDHTLKLWNADSGKCLLTLQGHSSWVRACAWSPDGERLLSASDDNTLKLWNADSGKCLRTLWGHSGPVSACAWSPDGERLLSASDDNTLKLWNATSGHCLLTLQGHSGPVSACAWSPDGQRLLSGSLDNTLKLWDATSGRCLWTGHLFPEGQTATIDETYQRVTHATPEAWRWLGWRVKDPDTGRLRILPYESFADLPSPPAG